MKKLLAIILALISMILLFTACDTTDETIEADTVSIKRQLLDEILPKFYLSRGDGVYESVIKYIQENSPDSVAGATEYYKLEDDYELEFDTLTRKLVLRYGDYFENVLCSNIDNPNGLGNDVISTMNNTSFCKELNKIIVWKYGDVIWKLELPSDDIEILGTIITRDEYYKNYWRIIVRSGSSLGYIEVDGDDFTYDAFSYKEITADCVGLSQKDIASLWYVNKDSKLIHVNLLNLEMETITEKVTNLVNIHDGIHSIAWREEGSLEWHEPTFFISEKGEKTPWSERGGM